MEEEPATGNNRNQGKCLGTKLGALQKCKRCRVITAEWVGDIALGCTCMKSNNTATAETSKASCLKICQQRTIKLKNTAEVDLTPD